MNFGLLEKAFVMEKQALLIFLVLVVSPLVLVVNAWTVRLPAIGTAVSLVFLFVASWVTGQLLFHQEDTVFRVVFGFIAILVFLALTGNALIVVASFTETVSFIAIAVLGVILGLTFVRFRKSYSSQVTGKSGFHGKKEVGEAILLVIPFLVSTGVAFWMLWLGRTGEGGASVWLTIPNFFIPLVFLVSFSLMCVLVFTRLRNSLKLGFVCIFSFLVHSLFLLVWYPGRYGDPWVHLGEARYIAKTGIPYAYSWMVKQFLIVDLTLRVQESLTVFFGRMFLVELYWVHVVLVPLLWSTLVPLIAYKIAQILTLKKSEIFPILTAIATVLFPSLISWGTVSVPNSLGFIFFFSSIVFLLSWMKNGQKREWLLSFLTCVASFLAHPQAGLFAFMLFFWASVIQRSTRRIWSYVSYVLLFLAYPLSLLYVQTSFSLAEALDLNNFLSFQSEMTTIMLTFGIIGLILSVKNHFVRTKSALVLFVFYVTVMLEYYITRFAMTHLPYGAGRILTMADFVLVPFVALGFFMVAKVFGKLPPLKSRIVSSISSFSKSSKISLNRRFIVMILICLFLSFQTAVALYQAYSHDEIVKVQPAFYELEAIQYIESDAPGRYVVLCEPTFAGLAIGFLGIDYGYAGGVRGIFGIPEWWYPTVKMYLDMTQNPSTSILQEAMDFADAEVSYFVVSVRNADFTEIVKRTSLVFSDPRAYRVFGENDELYVFKYPLIVVEEIGSQVKVVFDDGASIDYINTSLSYMFESEINSTLTLSGFSSYNITEFPKHWTFLDLKVNNVSEKFDDSSDINTFIYVKELDPSDILTVTWLYNRNYPEIGWKEDSFRRSVWRVHELYGGTMVPDILKDGNTLMLSYPFTQGSYWYYYYTTSVNIATNNFPYIIVRWRSNMPVAIVAAYFEGGGSQEIVALGSQSTLWSTTIVELPSNTVVKTIMVGLSNARNQMLSGVGTLEVDFILLSARTTP